MFNYIIKDGELYHYGIPGMRWGRKKAYELSDAELQREINRLSAQNKQAHKTMAKNIAIGVAAGTTGAMLNKAISAGNKKATKYINTSAKSIDSGVRKSGEKAALRITGEFNRQLSRSNSKHPSKMGNALTKAAVKTTSNLATKTAPKYINKAVDKLDVESRVKDLAKDKQKSLNSIANKKKRKVVDSINSKQTNMSLIPDDYELEIGGRKIKWKK